MIAVAGCHLVVTVVDGWHGPLAACLRPPSRSEAAGVELRPQCVLGVPPSGRMANTGPPWRGSRPSLPRQEGGKSLHFEATRAVSRLRDGDGLRPSGKCRFPRTFRVFYGLRPSRRVHARHGRTKAARRWRASQVRHPSADLGRRHDQPNRVRTTRTPNRRRSTMMLASFVAGGLVALRALRKNAAFGFIWAEKLVLCLLCALVPLFSSPPAGATPSYLSAEPIPIVQIVGTAGLSKIEGVGIDPLGQWATDLMTNCSIVANVIDTLKAYGAIAANVNYAGATPTDSIVVAAGGF